MEGHRGHDSEGGGVQKGVTARVDGYRGALQRGWRGAGGRYSEGGGVQRGVTARVEGRASQ